MTTPYLPFPVFRAFTSAGLPLAGGLLYTYAAGTTTPQNTYGADGVSTNTNPVVLDSTGSAIIRLQGLGYKFVLKDSGGSTQWTTDNVIGFSGDNPTFIGTVAASTFSASVSVLTVTLVASGAIAGDSVSATGASVPGSGINKPAANSLGLIAAGTYRAKVDSTGQWTFYEPGFGVAALANPATVATGTFTGTLTGFTVNPTATIRYSRSGSLVTLNIPGWTTATSNATTMTMTGLPAGLIPTHTQGATFVVNGIEDNGTVCGALAAMDSSGVLQFTKVSPSALSTATWTGSGTKGVIGGLTYTYALD